MRSRVDGKKKPTENDPLLKASDSGGSPRSSGTETTFLAPITCVCRVFGGDDAEEWLATLSDHFGANLMFLLFVVQHLLKGFSGAFSGQAEPYLYRSYEVEAPTMQIFQGVTALPYAMKPAMGLLSDILPINGYHKAPYILLTSAFGAAGFLIIGYVPSSLIPITGLVLCFFTVTMQQSTCDLLSEALYAGKIRESPQHGPALLSYVWGGLNAFSLLAVLCSGPCIYYLGPKIAYAIAGIPAALVVVAVVWGCVEEREVSPEELASTRRHFYEQTEACILCVVTLMCSLMVLFVGLVARSPALNCLVGGVAFLIMLFCFSVLLKPIIAKFNAFALIQTTLSPSIGAAAYYFYTDTAEQYPEGPHFSPFFFNSVLGGVGSVMSLIGIYSYQKYMSTWSYRWLLIVANVAALVLGLVEVVLFTRTNVKYGIPDEVFCLGYSVLSEVVSQWMWMPQVVILANLCPRGMEATMYALLAGCHNLGNTISAQIGAFLLRSLGVSPSGGVAESAEFENLWKAAVVASVLPFVTIVTCYWLIPNTSQTDQLLGNDISDATSGSLFRRWWLRDSDEEP